MTEVITADVETTSPSYNPLYNLAGARPVIVNSQLSHEADSGPLFLARPLFGPLLFENNDSDARDHCACERTFLSWLRLAIYMAIVSVAIVISFHLKHQPTKIERKMALPLGLIFWFLGLLCLAVGFANYIKTVTRYSRRQALVQTGWKTQIVVSVVATAIVAACVLFLATNSQQAK